jgi:hypothetical protein
MQVKTSHTYIMSEQTSLVAIDCFPEEHYICFHRIVRYA